MNVRELIEKLMALPQELWELPVTVPGDEFGGPKEVELIDPRPYLISDPDVHLNRKYR